jgi:glucose uptake protein GlcU
MLARPHLVLAWVIPGLVLIQAALAGQFLFQQGDIGLHGILGNVTFALTVVGLVLTVLRRLPGRAFAVAVALLALTFAQVGLGYVGREVAAAASWHIPNGVAIIALASYQLALLGTPRAPVPSGR